MDCLTSLDAEVLKAERKRQPFPMPCKVVFNGSQRDAIITYHPWFKNGPSTYALVFRPTQKSKTYYVGAVSDPPLMRLLIHHLSGEDIYNVEDRDVQRLLRGRPIGGHPEVIQTQLNQHDLEDYIRRADENSDKAKIRSGL